MRRSALDYVGGRRPRHPAGAVGDRRQRDLGRGKLIRDWPRVL